MLCVNDQTARKLSKDQADSLRALSRQVVAQLELRRSLAELRKTHLLLERTQKTSHENEEKFRQLAENITDVFWMASPDLQEIHYVSPGYEAIWGRPAEGIFTNPHEFSCFAFVMVTWNKVVAPVRGAELCKNHRRPSIWVTMGDKENSFFQFFQPSQKQHEKARRACI